MYVTRLRIWLTLVSCLVVVLGCDGDTPRSEKGFVERRGSDLIAFRDEVTVTESVPGDAIVGGGEVTFEGQTGGDYLGFGGRQRIGGAIGANVRAAGGQVELRGSVTRNATIAGGEIELAPGSRIGGNAYLAGGSIRITGTIEQVLHAAGGEVVIDGTVGDAHIEAGRLTIRPGARIRGNVRYRVKPTEVTIDPAAKVGGKVIALPMRPESRWPSLFGVLWRLGFLVAGAALIALFPGLAGSASDAMRRRLGPAAGYGLVWLFAVPIAIVVLAATVIGLPLALMAVPLYLASLYLSRAYAALWLGRFMLRGREPAGRRGLILSFLAGGVILIAVGFIPILGALIAAVATILGLGAFVLALRARPSPAPAR